MCWPIRATSPWSHAAEYTCAAAGRRNGAVPKRLGVLQARHPARALHALRATTVHIHGRERWFKQMAESVCSMCAPLRQTGANSPSVLQRHSSSRRAQPNLPRERTCPNPRPYQCGYVHIWVRTTWHCDVPPRPDPGSVRTVSPATCPEMQQPEQRRVDQEAADTGDRASNMHHNLPPQPI